MSISQIKRWAIVLTMALTTMYVHAHSSWKAHAQDMYEVFGFEESSDITDWMKYISSELIDGYNKEKRYTVRGEKVGFYDYLKSKFPDFKCKHRLLFHWGYNSRPWSAELQAKVESYKWSETKIKNLQQELVNEQKRRNRQANERTERLFGFASGGKDATRARALISLAYDVHLLGDYTPDNKDLDGLCSMSSIVGDIINNLRALDTASTKSLVSQIQKASKANVSDPIKAQNILALLKSGLPPILRDFPDRRIRDRVIR